MLDQDPGKLEKDSNLSHSRSGWRRTAADIVMTRIFCLFSCFLFNRHSPMANMG